MCIQWFTEYLFGNVAWNWGMRSGPKVTKFTLHSGSSFRSSCFSPDELILLCAAGHLLVVPLHPGEELPVDAAHAHLLQERPPRFLLLPRPERNRNRMRILFSMFRTRLLPQIFGACQDPLRERHALALPQLIWDRGGREGWFTTYEGTNVLARSRWGSPLSLSPLTLWHHGMYLPRLSYALGV